MKSKLFSLLLSILLIVGATTAFAPVLQPARVIPSARASRHPKPPCMSEQKPAEEAGQEQITKPAPTSGTFYDDEVDPIPAQKKGISNSMKERLIREASTGLDPDRKQTNVLLYIMAGVAVLVLLGGQGIFY